MISLPGTPLVRPPGHPQPSNDWTTGSYTDQSGQNWYWDGLHGWVQQGMTYSHPNDPAVIKKYFKGSKPTGPPPPLNPLGRQAQNSGTGGVVGGPTQDLRARLEQLLKR